MGSPSHDVVQIIRALICALGLLLTVGQAAAAELSPNNLWEPPPPFAGARPPAGWVLVVHGGGWQYVGPAAVARFGEPEAAFVRRHGWGAYDVDYRPGPDSLTDVLAAYDELRGVVGPRKPVCAWGGSAGGELVLMLAAFRPTLDCVITEAAPTDLRTLGSQPASPLNGDPFAGPRWTMLVSVLPSFGSDHLWWWSPVRVASRIRGQILMGASTADWTVPQGQMTEMKKARPNRTRTMLLPGGDAPFTHAGVTAPALASWRRSELGMLASLRASESARHASAGHISRQRSPSTVHLRALTLPPTIEAAGPNVVSPIGPEALDWAAR